MATAPPPYSVNDPQANPYPPQPPTAQAGYQQAGGYSQHPGSYPPQPGYPPQQAGSYPPQPGYPPQAGYPSQPYPQQSNQPPAVGKLRFCIFLLQINSFLY